MISINSFIPQNLEMSISELKLGLRDIYYERCGKAHEKVEIVGTHGSADFLWKCPFTYKNKNASCAHDNLFHWATEEEIQMHPKDQLERYKETSNRAYIGNLLRFILDNNYELWLSTYRKAYFYEVINYAADRLVYAAQRNYITTFPSQWNNMSHQINVFPVLKKDFWLGNEDDCIQICKRNIRSCLSLLNLEFSQEWDMVSARDTTPLTPEQEKKFYSHIAVLEEVSWTGFMSIRKRWLEILESIN